jgi:cysteine-rich repeat protein
VGYCVAFVACQKPDAEVCPSGRLCPAGSHCAAAQDICITTPCGNGKHDPGEVCEDGNVIDGDGCSSTCMSDERCGNGFIDRIKGEVCDDPTGAVSCSTDCKSDLQCGNDHLDAGEQCDPGGIGSWTPTCNANCTASRPGDGWANPAAGEECDGDGQGNVTTTAHTSGAQCEWVGTVGTTHVVCNWNCKRGSHGDGVVNASDGEQCDGGRGVDCRSAICNANCTPSRHGDGWVNPDAGEECDGDGLGNVTTVDAAYGDGCEFAGTVNGVHQVCNADCRRGSHGDGFVNRSDGELCDGTSGSDCRSSTCNWNCTVSTCGDGIYNTADPREHCDDGNRIDTDDCKNDCTLNVCGDGSRSISGPTYFEACDLGTSNTSSTTCPYTQSTCTLCSLACTVVNTTGPYCGDGIRQSTYEDCDKSASFACGTCDRITCRDVAIQGARGVLAVTATVRGGDTFTVDDGTNGPVIVEFDANGTCSTAIHTCIDVQGTATDVADRLRTAMTDPGWASSVVPADPTGVTSAVPLVNLKPGITGNVPIETSGTSVSVDGMSGGAGCPLDAPCDRPADCVSNRCRTSSKTCRPPL